MNMSESLFPQIAKMLDIELEEEFKVDVAQENEIFRISEKGFEFRYSGGYAEVSSCHAKMVRKLPL